MLLGLEGLISWALVILGVTTILTQSRLFEPVRDWWVRQFSGTLAEKMLLCPMCVGFWVGAGAHEWGLTIVPPLWGRVDVIAAGAAASFVSWATLLRLSRS